MKKAQVKIPQLRFPSFSGAWQEVKVKDIFIITRGKILANAMVSPVKTTNYKYPVYSSQTKNEGLMGYYTKWLFKTAITWTTDGANAGTVKYREGNFYSTNVCGVLISEKGHVNLLVAEILNKVAKRYVSVVGNPKLMSNTIGEVKFMMPENIEEQMVISNFISLLDNVIKAETKKLKHLEQQKRVLLQQIFPDQNTKAPILRFPGFKGKWEIKKIGEIAPVRGGYPFKSTSFKNKGVPIVKISNIFSNRSVSGEYTYCDIKKNDKNFLLKDKSLLIAMSGVMAGKVATLNNHDNAKVYQNQRVGYFLDQGKDDYSYISVLVHSNQFITQLKSALVAGAQPNISAKEINSFNVSVPTFSEQMLIGHLFNLIGKLITVEEKKINHLKLRKKALLQRLRC